MRASFDRGRSNEARARERYRFEQVLRFREPLRTEGMKCLDEPSCKDFEECTGRIVGVGAQPWLGPSFR